MWIMHIKVLLHAIQPHHGLTKGAVHWPVCAWIVCRSHGHRPPSNVRGLEGIVCHYDRDKPALRIAEQFCAACTTPIETACICITFTTQNVLPQCNGMERLHTSHVP